MFSLLIREKVRLELSLQSTRKCSSATVVHQRGRHRDDFWSDHWTLLRGHIQPSSVGIRFGEDHARGNESGLGRWAVCYWSRVARVIHDEARPRFSYPRCPHDGYRVDHRCWYVCSSLSEQLT